MILSLITKRAAKAFLILSALASLLVLTSCNMFTNDFGKLKSAFQGRDAVIQTYDEDSNLIDRIAGKSIDIGADDKFAIKDSEGKTVQKSGVLSFTVGGKVMTHVGSSLILAEKGLTDLVAEYAKTNSISNNDRSVPFINRIVNGMQNLTTGKEMIILIRSQSGKPLATYSGNSVSYFATDIDKSTGFIIDGKYLFVYRCDYTIYEKSLLE
ncbi:DUF5052 family protein [Paenibacillus sp. HJGM_3]|uniref:DUF5052 family protein n=1 Tax=Paenibacillus sp. HJGM_3 TaxID=3379816 RepID=UPI00385F2DF5